MAEPLVYLNGEILPYDQARVPVEDRGMQFADGVYEVIRYYGGQPFRAADHLARLVRSAAGIELPLPPIDEIQAAMDRLVREQQLVEASVYLQITRGGAPRFHGLLENPTLTVIAIARPVTTVRPPPSIRIVTTSDDRWARCYLKTTALLPNALARARARERGADDAVFVRDGFVMEGTASNAFAVVDGRLITPPANNYILSGITRQVVLELAAQEHLPAFEEPLSAHLLYRADEVFLTGTLSELSPVISVDGTTVGKGEPGPIYRQLMAAYDRLIRQLESVKVGTG